MKLWNWLTRPRRKSANPPAEQLINIALCVVFTCLLVFAIERIWGWPADLVLQNSGTKP